MLSLALTQYCSDVGEIHDFRRNVITQDPVSLFLDPKERETVQPCSFGATLFGV